MHLPEFLAYIDPGTGSLVLQAVIAGALGIAFYFRRFVYALGRMAGSLFGKKPESVATPVAAAGSEDIHSENEHCEDEASEVNSAPTREVVPDEVVQ